MLIHAANRVMNITMMLLTVNNNHFLYLPLFPVTKWMSPPVMILIVQVVEMIMMITRMALVSSKIPAVKEEDLVALLWNHSKIKC